MTIQSIFIGSIGVLAETSDIQRRAYNQSFREAGLDWHWDKETYRALLLTSGGMRRLRRLSADHGHDLSSDTIENIHARKTELACTEIAEQGVDLRPGIVELMSYAQKAGISLALVTTTYRKNIQSIELGARQKFRLRDFSEILTVEDVQRSKPHPEIYNLALARLGADPENCLAIEDSVASLNSAKGAGIRTLVTPGEYTSGQDYGNADWHYPSLLDFLERSQVLGKEFAQPITEVV